jgi:thiamine transport system ATP-binding protein
VARFLGFDNIVPAHVRAGAADTPWGQVKVPAGSAEGPCTLLVRPGGVRLTAPEDGLPCTVTGRTFRGGVSAAVSVLLQPDGDAPRLEAGCPLAYAPEADERVGVAFDSEEVVVLPNGS